MSDYMGQQDTLRAIDQLLSGVPTPAMESPGIRQWIVDAVEALRSALNCLSEASPRWVRTDDRKPEDGQTVLGCWRLPPSRREKFAYESLTYGAADSPIDGPEVWSHWDGEKADEPDYWMPLEALGEPK